MTVLLVHCSALSLILLVSVVKSVLGVYSYELFVLLAIILLNKTLSSNYVLCFDFIFSTTKAQASQFSYYLIPV